MQTTGVRIHGAGDVRMETFELPKLGAHELLARVVTDSMCMSTYKAVMQGSAHRCIPDDIAEHPCLIGHELCAVKPWEILRFTMAFVGGVREI